MARVGCRKYTLGVPAMPPAGPPWHGSNAQWPLRVCKRLIESSCASDLLYKPLGMLCQAWSNGKPSSVEVGSWVPLSGAGGTRESWRPHSAPPGVQDLFTQLPARILLQVYLIMNPSIMKPSPPGMCERLRLRRMVRMCCQRARHRRRSTPELRMAVSARYPVHGRVDGAVKLCRGLIRVSRIRTFRPIPFSELLSGRGRWWDSRPTLHLRLRLTALDTPATLLRTASARATANWCQLPLVAHSFGPCNRAFSPSNKVPQVSIYLQNAFTGSRG